MINGIDISENQKNIDFTKVKASGVDFVMMRASEGRDVSDTMFEEYVCRAEALAMDWGAYHRFQGRSIPASISEADFFISHLVGKRLTYPAALVVNDPCILCIDKESLTDCIVAFLTRVQSAGFYVALCCDPFWLTDRLSFQKLRQFDIWLSQPSPAITFQESPVYIWQYSLTGSVPGICGDVNLDASFKNYPLIIKSFYMNGFSKSDSDNVFYVGDRVSMVGKIYKTPDGTTAYTPYFTQLYIVGIIENTKRPYRLSVSPCGATAGFACASDMRSSFLITK